jgi:hypothetical protein
MPRCSSHYIQDQGVSHRANTLASFYETLCHAPPCCNTYINQAKTTYLYNLHRQCLFVYYSQKRTFYFCGCCAQGDSITSKIWLC